jgi:hypothetical protein
MKTIITLLALMLSLSLGGCYFFTTVDDDDDDSTDDVTTPDDDDDNDDAVTDDDDDTELVRLTPEEIIGTWMLTERLAATQPDNFCSAFVRNYSDSITSMNYDGVIKEVDGSLRLYMSQDTYSNVLYDETNGTYSMSLNGLSRSPLDGCDFQFDVLGSFDAFEGEETAEIEGRYQMIDLDEEPVSCAAIWDYLDVLMIMEA